MTGKLYRYVDMKPWSDGGGPVLVLVVYDVVRETPACWWIMVHGRERRVLKGWGKRFAHEQVEWAQHSWQRRKRFQLQHLRRQLAHVEKCARVEAADFPLPKETSPGEFSVGGSGYREFYQEVKHLADRDYVDDPFGL